METERYSISFLGLDPEYYTTTMIGDIWDVAAEKIYEETGISVSGEIHDRYFVNEDNGELNGSTVFMVESTRVPGGIVTEANYWNAYRSVIEEVRQKLGNPRMNLTIEEIDITYFERI